MGALENFSRAPGNKVDSGEQFGTSLREQSKEYFGNMGDFGNFSREHGSTGLPGGLKCLFNITSELHYKDLHILQWLPTSKLLHL